MERVREACGLHCVPLAKTDANLRVGFQLKPRFDDVLTWLVNEGLEWTLVRHLLRAGNENTWSSVVHLLAYWHPETVGEARSAQLHRFWITLTMPIPDVPTQERWYRRVAAAMGRGQTRVVLCTIWRGRGFCATASGALTPRSLEGAYHYLSGAPLCPRRAAHWILDEGLEPLVEWARFEQVRLVLGFLPRRDEAENITTAIQDEDTTLVPLLDPNTLHDWAHVTVICGLDATPDHVTAASISPTSLASSQ